MTESLRKLAAGVIAASKADQTEVVVSGGGSALTRFAGNTIHQNVAEENVSVTIRAIVGKRIGVASSNDVSPRGLKTLARTALDIAKHQPETPDFPGLPEAKPAAQVKAYSDAISSVTPAKRATAAVSIIKPAARKGATASGTISAEYGELAIANSLGVDAAYMSSAFEASAVIEKGSGAGYAGAISWEPSRVDVKRVGKVALTKCLKSADPQPIEAGEYTVVLEPQAVAELVAYMAYMGFGAQDFIDGTSFLTNRIGQKIMSDSVSIWDDGLDEAGMPAPFDYEGVPKQRVSFIEGGVAKGVVYDTYFAAKAGKVSTGHALPAGYGEGPLPTNIVMAAGTSSIEEMIASTEHGLLVTRFHYVNIADPANAVLTGLTRDGTFLITRGKVTRPVKNLRFTENMIKAFASVEALSKERSLEPAMLGAMVVPAAKIASFRFSGTTEF
jgi:PmbA protein